MVSADVKHHVYLLTTHAIFYTACVTFCLIVHYICHYEILSNESNIVVIVFAGQTEKNDGFHRPKR